MSLWQMSLQGGVMILLAAALRVPLKRRLPKWTFPALWALALARLMLPIALPLPQGVNDWLFRAQSAAPAPGQAVQTAALPTANLPTPNAAWTGTTPAMADMTGATPVSHTPFPWLWLWAAGALALAVYFAVAYWRGYRLFAASLPVSRPEVARWQSAHPLSRPYAIRESDRISTPLTYGVLRPVILLPKSARQADEPTLNALLTHEWTHIRRFDAAFKLALAAALCLHWPNPAVWLMYTLANRDLEFACDEAALTRLGPDSRASYARALLCMEALRDGSLPFCSGFGKSDIEERILSIMKTKKASPWALALALVLLLASVTAFAAPNPQAPNGATLMETDAGDLYTFVDGETGRVYYRDSEGTVWKEITPEEAEKLFPPYTIEWWTADEYAEWLENEKQELESVIGSRAWTQSEGWFTWTREKVDETIARYEQTLKDIQNGILISKKVNGSEDVMMAQGTAEGVNATTGVAFATAPSAAYEKLIAYKTPNYAQQSVADFNAALASTPDELSEFLAAYAEVISALSPDDPNYGFLTTTLDFSSDELFCGARGEPVAFYTNISKESQPSAWPDDEGNTWYQFTCLVGLTVSYDIPSPELITVAERDQTLLAFQAEMQDYLSGLSEDEITGGDIRKALVAKGVEAASRLSTDKMKLSFEIGSVEISDAGTVSTGAEYQPLDELTIASVVQEDAIAAVEAEPGTFATVSEATLVSGQEDAEMQYSGLDEHFWQKYGLTYKDGVLTWKGQRVSRFVDFAPDGGVFTHSDDTYRDGLSLYTVYGPDGTLTAVMPF